MRILLQFAEAIRRSWSRAVEDRDPRDAANMLERAVGDATDIDGATLLSLSPESIASVMQVSGVDRACPSTSRAACCWLRAT